MTNSQMNRIGPSEEIKGLQNGSHALTFSFMQVSEKNLRSLSSRSVLRQNRVCSKGRIFLIATSRPEGICRAEATVPYAPSPSR